MISESSQHPRREGCKRSVSSLALLGVSELLDKKGWLTSGHAGVKLGLKFLLLGTFLNPVRVALEPFVLCLLDKVGANDDANPAGL